MQQLFERLSDVNVKSFKYNPSFDIYFKEADPLLKALLSQWGMRPHVLRCGRMEKIKVSKDEKIEIRIAQSICVIQIDTSLPDMVDKDNNF